MIEAIITCRENPDSEGAHMVERWQELVRCKDCRYWQDNNDGYPHQDCKWNHDETPDPDDFCSAGEHK